MHARLAEIRTPRRVGRNLIADAFELSAPDVLQPLPLRRRRRRFVEIHGNLKALPDFRADMPCHGNAVFNRHAFNRDERHHVGGAHARMRTLMFGQVDQLRGLAYSADHRFLNRVAVADQRDHAAVVVGIHLAIKQIDAGHLHGIDNGVDFGLVAAFRKIRDTFDQRAGHTREG